MNLENIRNKIDSVEVTWNCNHTINQHEVGCPCKNWTKEELLEALILKKKFEQSGLSGKKLTA